MTARRLAKIKAGRTNRLEDFLAFILATFGVGGL